MGWGNRRWQSDEDVIASAQQSIEGVSDADAAAALAAALAQKNVQGGDD